MSEPGQVALGARGSGVESGRVVTLEGARIPRRQKGRELEEDPISRGGATEGRVEKGAYLEARLGVIRI